MKTINGKEISVTIERRFPGAIVAAGDEAVVVKSEMILDVMRYLKEEREIALEFLTNLTAVDYLEYFEVVYHLRSISRKQTLVVKTRCSTRENPEIPSVTSIWQGANLQEREVYDLMGIRFSGHPKMSRIFLWEGFEGHPLRKDYL